MDEKEALRESLKLVQQAKTCFLGTNGPDGFPQIKALLNLKHDGLKTFWFSTNTSSRRVGQIQKDGRACLYYVNEDDFRGLMLTGNIIATRDKTSRYMMWFPGSEQYYPLGVDDPDFTILIFTAIKGNYYHGLENFDFKIG